jgi:hypothetical protein
LSDGSRLFVEPVASLAHNNLLPARGGAAALRFAYALVAVTRLPFYHPDDGADDFTDA